MSKDVKKLEILFCQIITERKTETFSAFLSTQLVLLARWLCKKLLSAFISLEIESHYIQLTLNWCWKCYETYFYLMEVVFNPLNFFFFCLTSSHKSAVIRFIIRRVGAWVTPLLNLFSQTIIPVATDSLEFRKPFKMRLERERELRRVIQTYMSSRATYFALRFWFLVLRVTFLATRASTLALAISLALSLSAWKQTIS